MIATLQPAALTNPLLAENGTQFYRCKDDVEQIVANGDFNGACQYIARHSTAGVENMVLCCEAIHHIRAAYRLSIDQQRTFVSFLAEVGLVHLNDVAAPQLKNNKLTMLTTVGSQALVLRNESILPQLAGVDGYSTLYQMALHSKWLSRNNRDPVAGLQNLLRARRGDLDRESIREYRDSVEHVTPEAHEEPASSEAPSAIPAAGLDLVIATPSASDLARLGKEYANDERPDRGLCAPSLSESAVLVVKAKLRDFPTIEAQLLWRLGFAKSTAVLLASRQAKSAINDESILIVAQRGGAGVQNPLDTWDLGKLDDDALARRIVPCATRKLSLFADKEAEGWVTILRGNSWTGENLDV